MDSHLNHVLLRYLTIVALFSAASFDAVLAQTAPSLGSAASFAVLGASTVTCTGVSTITGDVGVSPGTAVTGFPAPCTVTAGAIQAGNAAALQAQSDAALAYAALLAQTCTSNLSGQTLGVGVTTLGPGVYCFSSSAQLTGTLNLTGVGPWIFQIGSTLTTASNASVLVNGSGSSQACTPGAFWAVGSSATVGTGTQFQGTILALVSDTVTTNANVSGGVFALTGAVTLDTNRVSACSPGPIDTCSGMIGDVVWQDTDGDGIQEAGEPGINGVTVRLKNSVGTVIKTVVTATVGTEQGAYKFTGVCAGTYTVEVDTTTLPPGLSATLTGAGPDRAVDSNGSPAVVTLTADNSSNFTIDFGYNAPCTGKIGDFVWSDTNANGIQDSGEPGINGVKVNLFDASGTTLLATTTTNSSGFYQFSGKCAACYTVKVDATTLPPNLTQTTSGAGSDSSKDSNGSPAQVVLNANNSVDNTIDFGYKPACSGTIGDYVWHDQNYNGIQDTGEPGLNGVTIRLKNSSGAVIATTVTATNAGKSGYYQFTGVCSGSFKVDVDQTTVPAGFVATTANAPGSTSNNNSNTDPSTVTLASGSSVVTNVDFGFVAPCTGKIGDFVWEDSNKNGKQDAGEPGINGVTINLRDPNNNVLLATTTTNSSGFYQFTGLCADRYKVEVVTPSGYTRTSKNASGVSDALDSDGSPVSVTLSTASSVINTIDFGFKKNVVLVCPHSQGYWKEHDELWPVSSLTLGSQTYTKAELLALLNRSVNGDASITLAKQLIAAKLNILKGAVSTPIAATITAADALLAARTGKLPYGLSSSSTTGSQMVSKAGKLEDFNTGDLTSGCSSCSSSGSHGTYEDHDRDERDRDGRQGRYWDDDEDDPDHRYSRRR